MLDKLSTRLGFLEWVRCWHPLTESSGSDLPLLEHKMRVRRNCHCTILFFALMCIIPSATAADWPQFRGAGASGVSTQSKLPIRFGENENLLWKVALPGAGSSSPVVFGKKVFVTCYSGYGQSKSEEGDINSLQRHLVCVDSESGQILWTKTIAGEQPEDKYQGYLTDHGYASNTPVTDGERVYCFFGKSGVIAFDFSGKQLWQTNVGKESSSRRWGSGASLILYKDSVIVNASEESQSIRALNKLNGELLWSETASALNLAYGTPSVISVDEKRSDLVIAVPGEVWGLNPDTGRLRWNAEHNLTGNICPSVFSQGDEVFIFGGFRSAGSLCLKAGGQGDVTSSAIKWTSRNSSYVATPVLYEGRLYWIDDRGQAFCMDAKNGELVYRERLEDLSSGGRPVYASPVVAQGIIYVPTRWDGVLVYSAKEKFEILALNKFPSDPSDFNATPAISNNQLFLRSDRFLYGFAEKHP